MGFTEFYLVFLFSPPDSNGIKGNSVTEFPPSTVSASRNDVWREGLDKNRKEGASGRASYRVLPSFLFSSKTTWFKREKFARRAPKPKPTKSKTITEFYRVLPSFTEFRCQDPRSLGRKRWNNEKKMGAKEVKKKEKEPKKEERKKERKIRKFKKKSNATPCWASPASMPRCISLGIALYQQATVLNHFQADRRADNSVANSGFVPSKWNPISIHFQRTFPGTDSPGSFHPHWCRFFFILILESFVEVVENETG